MNMKARTISILGETWEVVEGTEAEFPGLIGCDDYTDSSVRRIVIDNLTDSECDANSKADLQAYKMSVLRHEVIHAFLEESGLSANTASVEHWAENEEMVDWIAIQAPKIYKAFEQLGAV